MQTSVNTIDRNVDIANVWLGELAEAMPQADREDAWTCLNAVLQTVRDRMPVEEAANFAAQLPTIFRGSYYEGWRPEAVPQKWRHKDDYLQAVQSRLDGQEERNPEETVRAVLKVVAKHLDDEEIKKVKELHPKETWDLWPN